MSGDKGAWNGRNSNGLGSVMFPGAVITETSSRGRQLCWDSNLKGPHGEGKIPSEDKYIYSYK